MRDLAAEAIEAHGGMARWRRFNQVQFRQTVHSQLCLHKAPPGLRHDLRVTLALQRQWARLAAFAGPGLDACMEPDRVVIENRAGQVMSELHAPGVSFQGHTATTRWTALQLAYFISYAMWSYLTVPFLFAMPGVQSVEIAPWDEYGERWRRLRVRFPFGMASHCREQVFYFDAACLLQRHDYDIDLNERMPVAQYVAGHRAVSGIIVPTCRVILNRLPDNSADAEPVVTSIKFDRIKFS